MSLRSITVDGEPLENASGNMNMRAYTYENVTTFGPDLLIEQSATYDGYDMAYSDGSVANDIVLTASVTAFATDMKFTQSMALPIDGIQMMGLHTQLRDGLMLSQRAQASSYATTQVTLLDNEVLVSQKSGGSDYDATVLLDQNGISITGGAGAFTSDMQMPFPIALAGSSVTGSFLMPLLQSDTPQDAAFRMDVQGLTLNPEIWALADPTGQLPRDPMTFAFDLAGQFDLTADLVNLAMMAVQDGSSGLAVPVSADLKSLLLSAVGTELTGNGAFTFDSTDTETFDGMPRPEGRLDLNLTGANTLINTLIAMGLLPEDQAMSARMMMGLFAAPGEGEDTLTSTIEVNEQGNVLANGQRLK